MAGRFSHATVAPKPARIGYTNHVTGWGPSWLDSDMVPRTWDLTINTTFRAVLRIDRDDHQVLRGRLKVCFSTEARPHP
jgi:hypothetical protein